jgi:hypothetical protein
MTSLTFDQPVLPQVIRSVKQPEHAVLDFRQPLLPQVRNAAHQALDHALETMPSTSYSEPTWMSKTLPKLVPQSTKADIASGLGHLFSGKMLALGSGVAGLEAILMALGHHMGSPLAAGSLASLASLGAVTTALTDTQALRYLARGINRIA